MVSTTDILSILSLIVLLLSTQTAGYADPSCNVLEDDRWRTSALRAGKGAFVYDNKASNGPSNWGRINCPGYFMCKVGRHQSPINIISVKTWVPPCRLNLQLYSKTMLRLSYRYAPNDFIFRCTDPNRNCGHIRYRNVQYNFLQTHFHSPSEHAIDGKLFPAEIHFVHQNVRDQSLAVLGVFVRLGKYNPEFQKFLEAARSRSYADINMRALLADVAVDPQPCTLLGSLTTPPCSEGVQWLLSTKHMYIGPRQLQAYREMVGYVANNRPLQSMIGRSVRCFVHDKSKTGPVRGRFNRRWNRWFQNRQLPLCGPMHY